MPADVVNPPKFKHNAIIFIFGAFGPLAAVIACVLTMIPAVGLRVFSMPLPMLAFLFAYLFGIVPALVTGITYAFASRGWQRIALSPAYGALSSAIFAVLIGFRDWQMVMLAGAVGAAAALICAITVRLLKADLRSAASGA